MHVVFAARWLGVFFLALIMLVVSPSEAAAQMTPDQAADMVLQSARRAYNEKNYSFAIARFREFLGKYSNHKAVPSARFGLALALVESPERDYNAAVEQLQPLAGDKNFAEHAQALYFLGLSQRGIALKELAQISVKPQEAQQRRTAANQRFEEAGKQFAAALAAFLARVKDLDTSAKELPLDLEWACRSRCDLAEMQLRTQKLKEAQATAEPFVKNAVLAKSRYRPQGLYYHGFASFLLKDYLAAGRSLNQLSPFTDAVVGAHARYLVARLHHQNGERQEAALHYDGVIAEYVKQKQAAIEALKQLDKLKTDPNEKLRLEALTKDPPPEYVARATFNGAVLLYEDGKFADAATRFTAFMQEFAKQPATASLAGEAQLRLGFCQVQQRDFTNAQKTLQPLVDKEPKLADQALLWLAKTQIGVADPNNAAAYEQALKTALDTLRRAAERAQQISSTDADAKARRGEILLELGDTQQLAKQFKDAAGTYGQITAEKCLPNREEEVLQRQVAALHLAGDYAASDQAVARFIQTYPKSTLLPAVLFRHAENAAFQALAVEKNANLPNRVPELARLHDEAIKRYQVIVAKYPEFAFVSLARFGIAQALYKKGDFEKAKEALEAIPAQDRNGDLAFVPYLLADCLIRLAPTKADDAIAAGRMEEQLKAAADLLEGFVGAQPAGPQTPDALLKLGYCQQRLGALHVVPQERAPFVASARAAYEKLIQQFPKHELQAQAVFERAKCVALAGDVNGAINELRRFTNEPLKSAPVAPLGVLELATLLRGQNKSSEAADLLQQCRQQHEQKLAQDPARAGWVALLQYHHGVALKEAGKFAEAKTVLNLVLQQSPNRPEAIEAALRWGQCLKDDSILKLETARKKLASPNLKPEEIAAANKLRDEGLKEVREAIQFFDTQADHLKQKQPAAEARARMHYDAAWCCRTLAEQEVTAARAKIQTEKWQKRKDEEGKKTPPGQRPRSIPAPDMPLSEVPLQPSELKTRAEYQALVAAFPDLPLAADARFELAELHADRGEHDTAIKLLREALDKEPNPELTDKIRVRLGTCIAAKGDPKAALALFNTVAQNPKSPLAGQAHYRAGECLLQTGDANEAVKHLVIFRDQPPFQNLPGVSDRALLRLGHAFAQLKQWDQSRDAHGHVIGRFGNSPWVHEARYGVGWAWQNQKQFDHAVNAYQQVTSATASEIGAKAQLQIGLCRLEQKRYAEATSALLVVPFTYDYPELNAIALSEAARAFVENKQHEHAVKLLERVIREHPDTKWADAAKERLATLTKS
jgi:TolA-binding protein